MLQVRNISSFFIHFLSYLLNSVHKSPILEEFITPERLLQQFVFVSNVSKRERGGFHDAVAAAAAILYFFVT